MVFAFGYRLTQGDVEIEDAAQGSGIQSFLMLETLYLIDRDYFQKFGWRQAAIWAVEEPESSLHTSLEAQVASYLSAISADPTGRLQVLCTTHSDLMLQYANKAVVVEHENGQSKVVQFADSRQALDHLSRAGVSRWSHPILYHPLDPLVLVEGKYDCTFLEEAFKLLHPRGHVRIACLEQLTDGSRTGGSDLLNYIREHSPTIKNRPKDSPVIVILDWDAARKKDSFCKPFTADDPYKVLVWPETSFNPKLGQTFKGIERHYSDRLITHAEAKGVKVFKAGNGTCSVESQDYGNTKQVLHEIVKLGLREKDLIHAKPFLQIILASVGFPT
jgi:hypothetical protein